MIARVVAFEGSAEQLDQAARAMREEVDPRNSKTPGFVESVFLVDRERGSALLVALWEDAKAVETAERKARAEQRKGAFEATGGRRLGVETYEVAASARGAAQSGGAT